MQVSNAGGVNRSELSFYYIYVACMTDFGRFSEIKNAS